MQTHTQREREAKTDTLHRITTTTISSLTYAIVGSTAVPAPTANTSISALPVQSDAPPQINNIVLQDVDLDFILIPPPGAAIAPRQVTVQGNIPPYATGCADPAAYSSACSCAGITTSITTVPTPVGVSCNRKIRDKLTVEIGHGYRDSVCYCSSW
jgi:hypothetical protein